VPFSYFRPCPSRILNGCEQPLTLALLPPVVEVTTISLRHSLRQRRASFNEVKVETAPSLVKNQALPSLAKSLATSPLKSTTSPIRIR
jgi:hypothetical protein